jgi:hypothetical protein
LPVICKISKIQKKEDPQDSQEDPQDSQEDPQDSQRSAKISGIVADSSGILNRSAKFLLFLLICKNLKFNDFQFLINY